MSVLKIVWKEEIFSSFPLKFLVQNVLNFKEAENVFFY